MFFGVGETNLTCDEKTFSIGTYYQIVKKKKTLNSEVNASCVLYPHEFKVIGLQHPWLEASSWALQSDHVPSCKP